MSDTGRDRQVFLDILAEIAQNRGCDDRARVQAAIAVLDYADRAGDPEKGAEAGESRQELDRRACNCPCHDEE